MSSQTGVPEVRISAYMSLEQAMAEVRTYLEAKKIYAAAQPEMVSVGGHMSAQGAYVLRLTEFAEQLGQVDPNSKLGSAGFFLKRLTKKLIGWYSRPSQEFDRTSVQAFQQIRQDMMHLQQQIAMLQRKLENATAAPVRQQVSQAELLTVMLPLFRSTVTSPAVRKALEQDRPELLQRVESLLDEAEREFGRS
jgi:predicted unusual protein kinase regulating ubiquinone biosynthesis (AarF/ABC1/UbiB family)